ncbi:MAG: hypothetical protein HQK89_13470 [Nitrospirae bacterium]|nr:hypothetical protein [Nitrospirota bacterium]
MDYKSPLSGDVSQVIDPFSFWAKVFNPQTGFININNVKSSDSDMELKIIREVASYGKQIGYISDLMEVIVENLPIDTAKLDETSRLALEKFKDMYQKINRIKEMARKPTPTYVKSLIEEIDALKNTDEKSYKEIVGMLRKAFK